MPSSNRSIQHANQSITSSHPELKTDQVGTRSNSLPVGGDLPRTRHKSVRRTILNGVKNVLGIAGQSADAFPPLKSTLGALLAILKAYDQYSGNAVKAASLISRLESLNSIELIHKDETKEVDRRNKLQSTLNPILADLRRMFDQNKLQRVANSSDDEQKMSDYVQEIHAALVDYQVSLQQDLYRIGVEAIDKADLGRLQMLPHAKDAGYMYGNHHKCLTGTRTELLQRIQDWADDGKDRRVYWMSGLVGSGKTTIACTFAELCVANDRLGACFFCSRSFASRNNIHLIFPTLAIELAYRFPEFRTCLLKVISSSFNPGQKSLSVQLKTLLVEPLKSTRISTIIIIDALDECIDEYKDYGSASTILSLLAQHIDDIPFVKFFITGRPEPRIRSGFRIPLLKPHIDTFVLHDVDKVSVDHDIKKFLTVRLLEVVANRSNFDLDTPAPWPPPEQVDIVVAKSSGLFIYAWIVLQFVSKRVYNPRERLQLITSLPDDSGHEGRSGLDLIYTKVLDDGLFEVDPGDFGFFERFRQVVASIVLLFNPLSRVHLSTLLGIELNDMTRYLSSLHSVLLGSDSDIHPLRVYHKSFADYITDEERCTNTNFWVDGGFHHGELTINCLELMRMKLKKNVCNLPRYSLNKDAEDLGALRAEHLGDAVEYACMYWANHLSACSANNDVVYILQLLEEFFKRLFLPWVEVLSIIGDLSSVVYSLQIVETWLQTNSSNTQLLDEVQDAQRWILYFFDVIQESAWHIYHSALPWSPSSSLIRKRYEDQLSTEVKLFGGADPSWDACIRTIQLQGVGSLWVAFSHSGDLVAMGGAHFGQICEAATGVCKAVLEFQQSDMVCTAFSPDDSLILSVSMDGVVESLDVQTANLVRTSKLDFYRTISVVFSPGGKMLATGSREGTIQIWDAESGECECILDGHSKGVTSICWSHNGGWVISGSYDETIKIWDISKRVCLRTFDYKGVISLACSPDSSKFASGSYTSGCQIHDAQSGKVLRSIEVDQVESICFSPTGEQIAYVLGGPVYIYDLARGVSVSTFAGHASAVTSMVFSPDGSSLVSAGTDKYVKIWQTDKNLGISVNDSSGRVQCISITPNGRWIASGAPGVDGMTLWDTATGLYVHEFAVGKYKAHSIAFSPDSSLVASICNNRAIHIYNVHTRHLFQIINQEEVRSKLQLRSVSLPRSTVDTTLCFSPDGSKIVARILEEVCVWDVSTGVHLAKLLGVQCHGPVVFSDDGKIILMASDQDNLPDKFKLPLNTSNHVHTSTLPLERLPDGGYPMSYYVTPPQYDLSEDRNWILDRDRRKVCWIPPDQRSNVSDCQGKKFVIGNEKGKVVILDFSSCD